MVNSSRFAHRIAQSPPNRSGLILPEFEHDACGVGFVCRIDGTPSHDIVADGLQILRNLAHRGACSCDQATGDGAGILIQMPHRFQQKIWRQQGIALPDPGDYGTGLVFLSRDRQLRQRCMQTLQDIVTAEGQQMLGRRRLPVNAGCLGPLSRQAEPVVYQVLIGCSSGVSDPSAFECRLFRIRKRVEAAVRALGGEAAAGFHIPSLSGRTLVYKGMLLADQLPVYFPDLTDPDLHSALAVVHQRYSTNTLPSWDLAQPFRYLCHNGEINTLRGNLNWLRAREHRLASPRLGGDLADLLPIAPPGASDSAVLDSVVELLHLAGRSLPHAIMMLIPEAWEKQPWMSETRKAFYDYHAGLVEPWDGPAAVPFTDGRYVGAVLDRNGLRPCRYTVTADGRIILASETGVLDLAPGSIRLRGRLKPGRMLLVDTAEGRIVDDAEIKEQVAGRRPYRAWLAENRVTLESLPPADDDPDPGPEPERLLELQHAFGYSREDLRLILEPMAVRGKEPVGSMGDDLPPAARSGKPRLLYDYFKQLFAQVTNPPLDALRETLVTSLTTRLGAEPNLLDETPEHARRLVLSGPVLSREAFARIKHIDRDGLQAAVLPMRYDWQGGGAALKSAVEMLCRQAVAAVDAGRTILILSDRGVGQDAAPIPALLATAGVHHHLIRTGRRCGCGIVVETGEVREIHHFCCLLGFGAAGVHPYLALDVIADLIRQQRWTEVSEPDAVKRYIGMAEKGILKVMSKMGISTLQSYQGAQIFEAVGLAPELVDRYFTGTPARIRGAGLEQIAAATAARMQQAYPRRPAAADRTLDSGGKYQWRRDGEAHQYEPLMLAAFRKAVFQADRPSWHEYTRRVHDRDRKQGLLRGLLALKPAAAPVPLDEVEPWTAIVKRFKTGAMSYGSISREAHETLAVAMNRIGGRSNSGEGGEDADRFSPDPDGRWRNSAIKQVASGRFGVTGHYLVNAAELQIKMAQGAKPGEGGQLPGFKVYPWIARTRHSTPYVGLISPPPHHDIYSIEDLAQLIYDLRCANPQARISVKLVATAGVGTIAAGVAKAGADLVLISGDSGGTGASPLASIHHAGLPWELGLPETHQTLVRNGLRHRIKVECDGQLKTGRDVAIACLLGAEEFGFGTIALVALGCIMMRVCHLNTCPVGIATQDPSLRQKFTGRPEHVVQLMRFLAEELREIMAMLGLKRVEEMVGRTDLLDLQPALDQWKAGGLDLAPVLECWTAPPVVRDFCSTPAAPFRFDDLNRQLLAQARPALETGRPVELDLPIRNIFRTTGTLLSSEIFHRHGEGGLPENTIVVRCRGSAGQSFFAFGAPGITVIVRGDANDYFGKGLSGAILVLRPPEEAPFAAEENAIVGNTAFYGATAGQAYIRGIAGERFCVRNSGVSAVVEGTGDHACEYMTGGRVVILGPTGYNTAAGMSGGEAYIYDESGDFGRRRCNRDMVDLEPLEEAGDIAALRDLVERHYNYTDSPVAARILEDWDRALQRFVKIMPRDYKRALARIAREQQSQAAGHETATGRQRSPQRSGEIV